MAEKTFNTGRVVGWSSYEEFIKETGIDPSVITPYIYQTLVTYGVTRVVDLSSTGWVASAGGKFYTQTVRVPGASWGSVPIIGVDYEEYLTLFNNPAESTAESDDLDEQDKTAIEDAVGNVFAVYVSTEDGVKVTNSAMADGYLTFVAYPDVLNFIDNVQSIDGSVLRVIVRGLSMKDLDVDELYYGPQGFIFAGNGLAESCYHKTVNVNSLMIQASSYIMFSITGAAATAGGAYQTYSDMEINLEGTVSGYIDVSRLQNENYILDSTDIASFITSAQTAGVALTTDAYDSIPAEDKDDYVYMVYGGSRYTTTPPLADPLYILGVRKTDGYTGLGVLLNIGEQAQLGYDPSEPTNPPTRPLNLLYTEGDDSSRVALLKDRNMPDYIGSYWSKNNGWNGFVSYFQSNGMVDMLWEDLQLDYGAVFTDAGRNSYIVCTPPSFAAPIPMGRVIRIIGSVPAGEPGNSIRGVYVCTVSRDSDDQYSKIVLSRRGGYLVSSTPVTGPVRVTSDYSRLAAWSLTLQTPSGAEHYLIDLSDPTKANRIYQNELIWVEQAGDATYSGYSSEWVCVNIETSSAADLIVYRAPVLPLSAASSGVSNYSGEKVNSMYTNALGVSNLAGLLPTTITVYDDVVGSTTSSYTISRGGSSDYLTLGTLLEFNHSVSDVFGEGKDYWYQYVGEDSGSAVLASSVSQKDGTNFYTLAKMTSHLNQGFPRSKQDIPDLGGSYYYDYPRAISRLSVEQFFTDFGLDTRDYLHPDFRGTSLLKFLQNLVVYKHLGHAASAANKRSIGFSAAYYLFTTDNLNSIVATPPTAQNPIYATLCLSASTDPKSFSSPGFFKAHYVNPDGDTFDISNPDYPIWATVAQSRNGSQIMSVSLFDGDGSRLDGSGSDGTIEDDTVTPNDILIGLATGKSVDVLRGMRVRKTTGGSTYLVMADGTRLYVSTTEPQATLDDPIPDGAIGIGW